jgi:tetratricopeptide (TPR) repeat protein
MSLINRMLRDLSSRQPGPRDVMQGIQVPRGDAPRGNVLQRLGLLVVLVAAFTGGFWLAFGPKAITVPQPRGQTAGTTPAPAATVAPDGSPAAAAATGTPAAAAASAPPTKLKIDTELSEPSAKRAPKAPATAARSGAPRTPPPASAAAPAGSAAPAAAAPAPAAATADALYEKARHALERGDDAAADPLLNDALAANPNLHPAREDLGNLRIRQRRLDDADSIVRVGFELDPAYVGYRRLVARLELARNRPAAAIAALEREPPLLERDFEYHGLLASAYQRMGRHEEASRLYRDLVRAQPQEANWWASYAMSRDALGDVAGALAAYAQARQLGGLAPNVLEHINRRTATLQAQG